MTRLKSLIRDTRRTLEGIQAFGVTMLPAGETGKARRIDPADRLDSVRRQALACEACRLSKTRHSVVFGEGPLDAELVFVGEGPGRDEDAQGRPFVGAAGTLLTKIIQAMGLRRESVYITNVVKCRPPMNRPPEPDEIAACHGYLEAQLAAIRPKVICALGRTAAVALLKVESPMSQLRGRTFQWGEIPVVVTFHPAYLLRNPSAKALVWQDMQRLLGILKP
ncbi:MAG: uracil-DNA glycosylase [Candidatus Omnitrophica bacterium]|nr:uracil-DNA glycosylase [Candidatus Omnitrophota bacterium]